MSSILRPTASNTSQIDFALDKNDGSSMTSANVTIGPAYSRTRTEPKRLASSSSIVDENMNVAISSG